jgi:hypothetical protein
VERPVAQWEGQPEVQQEAQRGVNMEAVGKRRGADMEMAGRRQGMGMEEKIYPSTQPLLMGPVEEIMSRLVVTGERNNRLLGRGNDL